MGVYPAVGGLPLINPKIFAADAIFLYDYAEIIADATSPDIPSQPDRPRYENYVSGGTGCNGPNPTTSVRSLPQISCPVRNEQVTRLRPAHAKC